MKDMKDNASPATPKPRRARLKLLDRELQPQLIDPASRKQAAAVLEVLAGLRTPQQAADALGLSLPTYFNLETRALRGLISACAPRTPGREPSLAPQLHQARARLAQMEKELGRYRALLRSAQRSAGLAAAPEPDVKARGRGKRKKPAVRAMRVIQLLHRQEQLDGPLSVAAVSEPPQTTVVAAP